MGKITWVLLGILAFTNSGALAEMPLMVGPAGPVVPTAPLPPPPIPVPTSTPDASPETTAMPQAPTPSLSPEEECLPLGDGEQIGPNTEPGTGAMCTNNACLCAKDSTKYADCPPGGPSVTDGPIEEPD